MQLGNLLFGSYNAGVSLFCLLQALALAFAMAYAANKIIEWGAPIWLVLLANGITVFNPVIQTYAVTTAKDSLFAVFFILTVTLLIEMLRTPEALASVPICHEVGTLRTRHVPYA